MDILFSLTPSIVILSLFSAIKVTCYSHYVHLVTNIISFFACKILILAFMTIVICSGSQMFL